MKHNPIAQILKPLLLFNFLVWLVPWDASANQACLRALADRTVVRGTELQQLINAYEPFNFTMSPITLGEEIEAYVPAAYGMFSEYYNQYIHQGDNVAVDPQLFARMAVAERVAKILNRVLSQDQKPKIWIKTDDQRSTFLKYRSASDRLVMKTITVTHDHSLGKYAGHVGVEITSPIMRENEDYDVFDNVMDFVQAEIPLMIRPDLDTGLHIHIGMPDAKPEELIVMLLSYAKIQEQLRDYYDVHWHRNNFAQVIPADEIKIYLKSKSRSNKYELEDIFKLLKSRDRAFNIYSLQKHGTVEFRLFDSTLDRQTRKSYRMFARRFVETIRQKDPVIMKLLLHYENSDTIPLKEYLQALGLLSV